MHWTLPSRARRHRQRHSKPANVASFTLRVSLRPEAMKATLSIEARPVPKLSPFEMGIIYNLSHACQWSDSDH